MSKILKKRIFITFVTAMTLFQYGCNQPFDSIPTQVEPAKTASVSSTGYFDLYNSGTVYGWAWQPSRPNDPISVHVYVDGQFECATVASQFRQDLKNLGYGNGNHGFMAFINIYKYGQGYHEVKIYAVDGSGNNPQLNKSPQTCFFNIGYYQQIKEWGQTGNMVNQISLPTGMGVNPTNGDVLILDWMPGNYGSQGVKEFDSNGNWIITWGSAGYQNGQFETPSGMAIDKYGYIYIGDEGNRRIQKLTSNGVFVLGWGSYGSGNGQFKVIRSVAVDNTMNVYVADEQNQCIQVFGSNGVFKRKWQVLNDPGWQREMYVTANSKGEVFVSIPDYKQIRKYSSTGAWLTTWSSIGEIPFQRPCGIAADKFDNIYFADCLAGTVYKFTSNGEFVGNIPTGYCTYVVTLNNNVYVLTYVNGQYKVKTFVPSPTEPVFHTW